MGVASFYRWLVEKYAFITVKCLENRPVSLNGVEIPVDWSLPNPNGLEFDNLYFDMNGIIHNCSHPDDGV